MGRIDPSGSFGSGLVWYYSVMEPGKAKSYAALSFALVGIFFLVGGGRSDQPAIRHAVMMKSWADDLSVESMDDGSIPFLSFLIDTSANPISDALRSEGDVIMAYGENDEDAMTDALLRWRRNKGVQSVIARKVYPNMLGKAKGMEGPASQITEIRSNYIDEQTGAWMDEILSMVPQKVRDEVTSPVETTEEDGKDPLMDESFEELFKTIDDALK